jgi:hypothetical protein
LTRLCFVLPRRSDTLDGRVSDAVTEKTAWRIVAILSVVEFGAAVGNESARYFWDLTAYVEALDSAYPYRFDRPYPFLYPPFAADLFTLARSHLFELFSIAYVAAAALFLSAFAQLDMRRRFLWLLAICAMGGLGVVSLQSGNVGVLMNLAVLALAFQAAMGKPISLRLLPIAIGLGALIKPQFGLYLGLLPCVERSRRAAFVKMLAVLVAVVCVYAIYALFRPNDWNEYVQAVIKRTIVEKDFGWGPTLLVRNLTDSNAAAIAAYIVGLLIVGALSYAAWQKSVPIGPMRNVFLVSLAFFVLTFANPRIPFYDVFAAAIALAVCCGLADRGSTFSWVLVVSLAINLVPWLIANFARVPDAYPWWLRSYYIPHSLAIVFLLVTLSRVGFQPAVERSSEINLSGRP